MRRVEEENESELYTCPLETGWRVGDEQDFICFDFAVFPHRREAIIHSYLVLSSQQTDEDFLYEVVPYDEAIVCALSMIDDATEYLEEAGVDDPVWHDCDEFVEALQDELEIMVH